MPKNIISFTLYSKRTDSELGYYDGIFREMQNIKNIVADLTQAAIAAGDPPPVVQLNLFLVPKKGEKFESPDYCRVKESLFAAANKNFIDIDVIDFFDRSVAKGDQDAVLRFLHDNQSMGSVADILKAVAIIDNEGANCLQLDTNTELLFSSISDVKAFYAETFGSEGDAYNLTRASDVYIACHNKIVYTSASSRMPEALRLEMNKYLSDHAADDTHKVPTRNKVYEQVFVKAAYKLGLTYKVSVDNKRRPGEPYSYYPAKPHDDRYRLVPFVAPCQRESWRAGMLISDSVRKLTKLAPIKIDGIDISYFHFKSMVKVLTNIPEWQSPTSKVLKNSFNAGLDFTGASDGTAVFLDKVSNERIIHICAKYALYVSKRVASGVGSGVTLDDLTVMLRLIPDTPAGKVLCHRAFGLDRSEILADPLRIIEKVYEGDRPSGDDRSRPAAGAGAATLSAAFRDCTSHGLPDKPVQGDDGVVPPAR